MIKLITRSFIFLLTILISNIFALDALFDVPVNYYTYRTPYAICSFDFDGDNDNDLAVALYGIDYVSVMLNDGNGAFPNNISMSVGDGPLALYAANLNNDNKIDLAVVNSNSNNVSILLNNGDGTFQSAVNYNVGTAPSSVFSCDLDNDYDNDLTVVNYSSYAGGFYHISVLLNNGDGTFQNEATYPVGSWPIAVFGSDFDNDGYNDIAVTSFGQDLVSVLINNGDGTFISLDNYTSSYGPNSVFSCYLNNDNFNDLAVSNSSSDKVSVFFNNGDGTFEPEVTFSVGSLGYYPTSIFCADFDGDDDNDIVTANKNSNNISILLNNGDETFQPAINYFAGTGSRSVCSADFDGDNDKDIAVANFDADTVSIFFNRTNTPSCCIGITGNVDGSGDNQIDIADIVYFIDYSF
ncbi:MAG: FG-GAP repeat domain-containing protein, partial [Candidatus Zixiibacteriota bacterium]